MRACFVAAAVALVSAAGCVLDDLDYEDRPCPCASGWTCVADRCVRGDATDGAVADAPRTDAPGADGGVERCSGDLLFCDGFEDGEGFVGIGPWDARLQSGGDAVATTERARTGAWSLSATTTAEPYQVAAIYGGLGGVDRGELWARAWLYIPSGQEIDTIIPLSVGWAMNGFVHAVLGTDRGLALWVGDHSSLNATVQAVGFQYPEDEWLCLRLQVAVADEGSAVLYLGDDAIATTSGSVDTLPDGDYHSVIAGIGFSAPAQGPARLYVDDVAVHTSEIGCE